MVKQKIGKKKDVKYGTFVKGIYKTRNGKRQKYVNVTIRKKGKTVNKQYKYRGGKFRTYVREATLKKGTKYYVDYQKNKIIRSPQTIDKLVKKVRVREAKKTKTKKTKKILKKKEALSKIRIVPKRTYKVPEPVEAKKVVDMLTGKLYYEREHSIKDFSSRDKESTFLVNMFSKATKNKKDAKLLTQNFEKVALKMSYGIVVETMNTKTKEVEQIGFMTAIGKKPTQIVDDLKRVGLVPNQGIVNLYSDVLGKHRNLLNNMNFQFNKTDGEYMITDVRMTVKFYNNPQRTIR